MNTLTGLDKKYHATDRAVTADQSYGISQRANTLWSGLNSYFEKATNTPTGKKLVDFCKHNSPRRRNRFEHGANHVSLITDSQSQRQVTDIHTEARRLADLKKNEHGGSAYKASGLERVFGAEKPKNEAPSSGPGAPAAAGASTTTETTQPVKPAEGGLGTQESTTIPQPEKSG